MKHQYVALDVSCETYILVGEDIILPIGEHSSPLRIKGKILKMFHMKQRKTDRHNLSVPL